MPRRRTSSSSALAPGGSWEPVRVVIPISRCRPFGAQHEVPGPSGRTRAHLGSLQQLAVPARRSGGPGPDTLAAAGSVAQCQWLRASLSRVGMRQEVVHRTCGQTCPQAVRRRPKSLSGGASRGTASQTGRGPSAEQRQPGRTGSEEKYSAPTGHLELGVRNTPRYFGPLHCL